MQNQSNRGSGKPVRVRAHQARAFDWGPIPRIAIGPAVVSTASTGRTHDRTRPACINLKTTLAKSEPSTHDPQGASEVPCHPYWHPIDLHRRNSFCDARMVQTNGQLMGSHGGKLRSASRRRRQFERIRASLTFPTNRRFSRQQIWRNHRT